MSTRAPLARFGALSFTYFGVVGLFNPYAPLWFQSLGFSALVIGGIASLQAWTRVLAPYAWSWVGDHYSSRRIELIRLACGLALAAALGLLAVRGAWPVALVVGLLFVANSGIVPLYETALAHRLNRSGGGIDPARYGRVRMWGSVGFIVAVVACGALLQGVGIAAFPVLVAVIYALLLASAFALPTARDDAHHGAPAPRALPLLKRPEIAWFFASAFFTVLAHTSLYTFFSLFLDALGYGKVAVGALWAVSVVAEIGFFWAQGAMFRRFTPHRWLELAALATALRFAATAGGARWLVVLVLAQLAHAVTFAGHHAACILLVHRFFPGRLRGRGQALYATLGYGLSGVLGGVAGGWLISRLGYAAVFWASSLCALLAWACARRAARAAARSEAAAARGAQEAEEELPAAI